MTLPKFDPQNLLLHVLVLKTVRSSRVFSPFQGCTVGYCSKNCPTGAFTNDNRFVSFKGNRGSVGTGSNGNAGPLNQAGVAVDPAAVSLLKQQEEYTKWAEQQIKNAERQVAGK